MFIAQRTMRGSIDLATEDGNQVLRTRRDQIVTASVPVHFKTGEKVQPNQYPEAVTRALEKRGVLLDKTEVRDEADPETAEDIQLQTGDTEVTAGAQFGERAPINPQAISGAPAGASSSVSFDD